MQMYEIVTNGEIRNGVIFAVLGKNDFKYEKKCVCFISEMVFRAIHGLVIAYHGAKPRTAQELRNQARAIRNLSQTL